MKLNSRDIQDYTFPPFCFNKQTFFNDFRIDIPSHHYKRFSTGTRWVYKRVIPYKYTRNNLSKQRTDHPFNQEPKYKNLGIYGLLKRDNRFKEPENPCWRTIYKSKGATIPTLRL